MTLNPQEELLERARKVIRELREKLSASEARSQSEPIAIIGMYGPPQNCKRKIEMTVWSAPMYSAFGGVQDPWP